MTRLAPSSASRSSSKCDSVTTADEQVSAAAHSVTTAYEREDTASHGVDRDRDEPLHADAIGPALASAMVAWCNDRDPRAMRRALLELLLPLDEM